MTITIESSTSDSKTLSRMNLSGYVCLLFISKVSVRIRVEIRFSVWLVICNAHIFVLLSIVTVRDCLYFQSSCTSV